MPRIMNSTSTIASDHLINVEKRHAVFVCGFCGELENCLDCIYGVGEWFFEAAFFGLENWLGQLAWSIGLKNLFGF